MQTRGGSRRGDNSASPSPRQRQSSVSHPQLSLLAVSAGSYCPIFPTSLSRARRTLPGPSPNLLTLDSLLFLIYEP